MNNLINTACIRKWSSPVIHIKTSEISYCCWSKKIKITDEDIQKFGTNLFSNHPTELTNRLNLLKGEKISSCNQCWNLEKSTEKSHRTRHSSLENFFIMFQNKKLFSPNEIYDKNKLLDFIGNIDNLNHVALTSSNNKYLEINLGNTCDLKCNYCGPSYSSQWVAEIKKYEYYVDSYSSKNNMFETIFLKWLEEELILDNIDTIGFVGGEPLIMPEFYVYLDKLIEVKSKILSNKKINIRILSNFNASEKYIEKFLKKILELSNYFKFIIVASIEDVEERAEYIRFGLNWKNFEKNIHLTLSSLQASTNFGFHPTINTLSVAGHENFVNWLIKINNLYDQNQNRFFNRYYNTVVYPDYLNPLILPDYFSDFLYRSIEVIDSSNQSQMMINYKSNTTSLADSIKNNKNGNRLLQKQMFQKLNILDSRRKTNFLETFPEFKKMYNEINKL